MKINEAKRKWCPMARAQGVNLTATQNRKYDGGGKPDSDCYCIASDCMFWREYIECESGSCGLVSKDTWQEKKCIN
jgi:hypothetical protein